MKPDTDALVRAYLSGQANESEVSELEALIIADPAVRTAFLRHARADAALSSAAGASLASVAEPPAPWRPISSRTGLAIAAGIAILTAVGAAWWFAPNGVSAEVLAVTGTAAERFRSGETVRLKTVELTEGDLRIRLSSGVIFDLSGPSKTRFVDPERAILHAGTLTADAGDSTDGFVVETGNTRVVDLGTRFGVSHHDNGDTDVVVLEGAVKVYKSGSIPEEERRQLIARLTEGEAIRVDSKYVTRRLAAVALRGKSLAIVDPGPAAHAIVTDVTDSNREANFRRFYSIQPGGMEPGARAYSTLGRPRWQPLPGEKFPEELRGADIVGTFAPDRIDQELQLTLQVAKPATIYVMLDSRAPIPGWLERDFLPTSLSLRCGPWGKSRAVTDLDTSADGEKYVTYQVWRREITGAGDVSLGPPAGSKHPRRLAMYGIAVQKKD